MINELCIAAVPNMWQYISGGIQRRDKALDDMVHELSRVEIDRDELLKEMQWRLENKNYRIAYLKRRLELAEKEREE